MSPQRKRPRKLLIYETSAGEFIVTASHGRIYKKHTLEEESNVSFVYDPEQRKLMLSPREKSLYEKGVLQNHKILGQYHLTVKEYKNLLEERREHVSEYWKRYAIITSRLACYVGEKIPKDKLRNRNRALRRLEQKPRPSLLDIIKQNNNP